MKIIKKHLNKICPEEKECKTVEDLDGIVRLYCGPEYIRETVEKFKDKGEEGLILLEKFVSVIHPMNSKEMKAAREAYLTVQELRKNQTASSSV